MGRRVRLTLLVASASAFALLVGFVNCSRYKSAQFSSLSGASFDSNSTQNLFGLAAYQAFVQSGGTYLISWNLPFDGSAVTSGTNYVYDVHLDQYAFDCGSSLVGQPEVESLSAVLSLPTAISDHYLVGGQIVSSSIMAPVRVSCTADQTGLLYEYFADDGRTVVQANVRTNYAQVPLNGALAQAPDDLLGAIPLDAWSATNLLSANARWAPNAAYLSYQSRFQSDNFLMKDCGVSGIARGPSGVAGCGTNTLESTFPLTTYDAQGQAVKSFVFSDGQIRTEFGVRVWISNQPTLGALATTYPAFAELGDGVYYGLYRPADQTLTNTLGDGVLSDRFYRLNRAGLTSLQGAFVFGQGQGNLANHTGAGASPDIFGIGATGPNGALAPADLRRHYNVPANLTGAGQTIAIVVGPTSANVLAETNAMSAHYGLPALTANCGGPGPCLTTLDLRQGSGAVADDWGLEASLDVQAAHALAPNANLVVVISALNSNSDLEAAIAQAAALDHVVAVSMSFSSGNPIDVTATTASYPSVVYLAATGDGGAAARYPAVLPSVTGVGGTRLTNVTWSSSASEVAWPFSGGGPSVAIPMPDFQLNWLNAADRGANFSARTTPDVGAVADPRFSPFAIYYGQAWRYAGGTSLATPVWAGMTALIAEAFANQNRSLGEAVANANPDGGGFNTLLYAAKASSASPFYEVTSGSNNLTATPCPTCQAKAGYNDVTGIGAPNLAALIAQLLAQ